MKAARQLAQEWIIKNSPPFCGMASLVGWHLVPGAIYEHTPDTFALARRVGSDWTEDDILDLTKTDPAGDMLHIWLLAGRVPRNWRALIPPGIRFLSWHRGDKFKRIPFPIRE